jgi:putative methanogen marker protein 4
MIDLDGLLAMGCESRVRVGIGCVGSPRTVSRLRDEDCRVELVPFDSSAGIALALSRGEIDAGVRGTLSSKDMLRELRTAFGLDRVLRTAFLGSADGKAFMLTPVGIDEGRSVDERAELVRRTMEYLRPTGWSPSVGVLSKGRLEDSDRGEDIRRSLQEGDDLVRWLRDDGIDAVHHAILIEEAIRERDLLVAPDGVTGNLIFRALHFVGSGRAYGAPIVNLPSVFVDTSRAKADFAEPVLLAAGLAELGCGRAGRA